VSGLTFIPLGVGDAFSQLSYSSCLAVACGGRWLLLDCPHPIRKMMREAHPALDIGDVEAVALTHLHADHASGLEGLAYFSFFHLGRRARVVAHPEVHARLWDGHLAAGMEQMTNPAQPDGPKLRKQLADFVDWVPVTPGAAVEVGPFRLECRPTRHHVPTTAFRVHAGGRVLSYSADTSFDPVLVDWLAEADLVVHECNLGTHTPYASLAALPPATRRKMRLIHLPDSFDVRGAAVEPLEQGRTYSV
jgi:ribonuclease BN (tRNA processing enzyme)